MTQKGPSALTEYYDPHAASILTPLNASQGWYMYQQAPPTWQFYCVVVIVKKSKTFGFLSVKNQLHTMSQGKGNLVVQTYLLPVAFGVTSHFSAALHIN